MVLNTTWDKLVILAKSQTFIGSVRIAYLILILSLHNFAFLIAFSNIFAFSFTFARWRDLLARRRSGVSKRRRRRPLPPDEDEESEADVDESLLQLGLQGDTLGIKLDRAPVGYLIDPVAGQISLRLVKPGHLTEAFV